MTQTHKTIWAAGIIVVVLTIAFIVFWHQKHESAPSTKPSQTQQTVNHIQPTYTSSGQLVPAFPKELVLGTQPTITQSYDVPYSSQNQSATTYQAQDTPDKVFQAYLTYFQSNNYEIISKQQTTERDTVYASNKDVDISIIITSKQGKSSVTVNYLNKQS
jgi:hypothetical protein